MWSIVQRDYPFYIANANGSKRKRRPTSTRSVCRASGFVQTTFPSPMLASSDVHLETALIAFCESESPLRNVPLSTIIGIGSGERTSAHNAFFVQLDSGEAITKPLPTTHN